MSDASFPSTVTDVQSLDTELNADCVEWCPHVQFKNLLACGTYKLQENPNDNPGSHQNRVGRLHLLQFNTMLTSVTSLDVAGILDVKWSPKVIGSKSLFATVNADGSLYLYSVNEEITPLKQVSFTNIEENGLVLSLDWERNNICDRVAVSMSSGDVCVLQMTDGYLKPTVKWKAHNFEAWICSFDVWDSNTVYSGGDDCKLKRWDIRVPVQAPVATLSKHSMGVTSVQSNPLKEYMLASGSYDEEILMWDTRNLKRFLGSHNVGGGVWRLKWNFENPSYIAAACMHNGVHILELNEDDTIITRGSFTSHESMAYGVDWYQESSKKDSDHAYLLASCSFYDHNLRLWEWKPRLF